MQLEIVTPDKKAYQGEVDLVRVPGTQGAFAILKNHAPVISTLEKGEVKVVDSQNNELFFDIDGGVVEVSANKVIILAESI